MRAFIIHLDRAGERRSHVERLARELPIPTEVISAVDGRKLDRETLDRVRHERLFTPHYPFGLSDSETACFLSHRKAWKAIVESGCRAGLIIEDDVELASEFGDGLALADKWLRSGDYVRFSKNLRERALFDIAAGGGFRLFVPRTVGLGMLAQLVTSGAAARLLAATERFDRPVDTFLQMFWQSGVKPLALHPLMVADISKTLGGSTVQHAKGTTSRLFREAARPVYRAQIALASWSHRNDTLDGGVNDAPGA